VVPAELKVYPSLEAGTPVLKQVDLIRGRVVNVLGEIERSLG
jgi:hypothetical protein